MFLTSESKWTEAGGQLAPFYIQLKNVMSGLYSSTMVRQGLIRVIDPVTHYYANMRTGRLQCVKYPIICSCFKQCAGVASCTKYFRCDMLRDSLILDCKWLNSGIKQYVESNQNLISSAKQILLLLLSHRITT